MHTRILKDGRLCCSVLLGVAMAALSASGTAAQSGAGEGGDLCSQPFTICLWPGPASGPVDLTSDRGTLIRFLNQAARTPDALRVRFTRTPIIPTSPQGSPQSCDHMPTPSKQVEMVVSVLSGLDPEGAAADVLRTASGEDGTGIEGADAPACGAAFSFSVETDYRPGTRLCGYEIQISDAGWPTDAAAARVYRPVTLNGETAVIGERATLRLTPRQNGPLKPVAWVQLIAKSTAGERAGKSFETTALLTGQTEFDVAAPLTVRIGCGAAQMMSTRARNQPVFSGRTADDFLGWIADDKRAIGPELHPIDMDSLTGADDVDVQNGCGGSECGAMQITFENE